MRIYKNLNIALLLIISVLFFSLYPSVVVYADEPLLRETVGNQFTPCLAHNCSPPPPNSVTRRLSEEGVEEFSGSVSSVVTDKKENRELKLVTNILGEERIIKLDVAEGEELLKTTVNRIIKIIFSIAGVVLVIMLSVYGTQMIYAQMRGKVDDIVVKKKKIIDIAIGAGILLLSYLILNFINPDLLNPKLIGLNNSSGFQKIEGLEILNCTYPSRSNRVYGNLSSNTVKNPKTEKVIDVNNKKIVIFFYKDDKIQRVSFISSGKSFDEEIENIPGSTRVVAVPVVVIDGLSYIGGSEECAIY